MRARPRSPLLLRKLLKRLVGASGFEPPTSWSRTRRSSQAEPRPDQIQCRPHGAWEATAGQPRILSFEIASLSKQIVRAATSPWYSLLLKRLHASGPWWANCTILSRERRLYSGTERRVVKSDRGNLGALRTNRTRGRSAGRTARGSQRDCQFRERAPGFGRRVEAGTVAALLGVSDCGRGADGWDRLQLSYKVRS
jgi:hypothetical protein